MNTSGPSSTSATRSTRVHQLLVGTGALMLIAAALSVPFIYPTETLWYKSGTVRFMLLAGQLAGLTALPLLLIQIVVAVRPKGLTTLFGAAALLRWHRIIGMLIALLAISHALLILAPEGLDNLPLGWDYWPEMVGGLLLLVIVATVLFALIRNRLPWPYSRWRAVHRAAGYLAVTLVFLHVLFVSESFAQRVPRIALLAVGVALFVGLAHTLRRRSVSRSTTSQ
jgi:predicted ferric reductase